jgi:hypothetical protein
MCRWRVLYFIHSFIYFVDFLLGTKKLRAVAMRLAIKISHNESVP